MILSERPVLVGFGVVFVWFVVWSFLRGNRRKSMAWKIMGLGRV